MPLTVGREQMALSVSVVRSAVAPSGVIQTHAWDGAAWHKMLSLLHCSFRGAPGRMNPQIRGQFPSERGPRSDCSSRAWLWSRITGRRGLKPSLRLWKPSQG